MSKGFQENGGGLLRREKKFLDYVRNGSEYNWSDRLRNEKKTTRQTLSSITVFLLIVIVACFCINGIVGGVPSVFGYRVFFIMSESMEPTIRTHQFVVGRVIGDDEPEMGDVVAYEKGDDPVRKMVIHRIVGVTDDGKFILQGDHNETADVPVESGRIKYKVLGVK
ncbi:MAG: signal peptidase I [Lachnospiraceae bacterium]|nr:signal peptidase I [Lachnospiraceae bacterium]